MANSLSLSVAWSWWWWTVRTRLSLTSRRSSSRGREYDVLIQVREWMMGRSLGIPGNPNLGCNGFSSQGLWRQHSKYLLQSGLRRNFLALFDFYL